MLLIIHGGGGEEGVHVSQTKTLQVFFVLSIGF